MFINFIIFKGILQNVYIVIESPRTLCKELDIIDVNFEKSLTTNETGEKIALKIIHQTDHFEKFYESEH